MVSEGRVKKKIGKESQESCDSAQILQSYQSMGKLLLEIRKMLGMELKMERSLMCSSNHKHVQLGYSLSISTTLMHCKTINKMYFKICDCINSCSHYGTVPI